MLSNSEFRRTLVEVISITRKSESCVQRNKHTDLHEDLNTGIGFPGKRKGS